MSVVFSRNSSDYPTFGLRGKKYMHIAEGWSVREVQSRSRQVFRLYHGPVLYGRWRPEYVTAVDSETGKGFVDFDSFAEAVAYIEGRRTAPHHSSN